MQFPVFIALRRSVRLSLILAAAHTAAFGAVCVLPLSWQLQLPMLALIPLAAWKAFAAPRIVGFRILASNAMVGVTPDGSIVTLAVSEQSVVYRRLVLLRARFGDERLITSFVLLPDQMTAGQFHQLRLWLRCQTEFTKHVEVSAS